MITAYFWVKDKCVEYSGRTTLDSITRVDLFDCPCVDITCIDPEMRYGVFVKSGGWEAIPLADMPKELLAHVLLLT